MIMNFRNLKLEACPVCGCSIVVNEHVEEYAGSIRKHINGQTWEHKRFLCGQEVMWEPAFEAVEVSATFHCRNDEEYRKKVAMTSKAWKDLDEFVDTLEVDDTVKAKMKSRW